MSNKTLTLRITKQQRDAIEQARGGLTMATFVRDAIGAAVEAAGIEWPADPILGGNREKQALVQLLALLHDRQPDTGDIVPMPVPYDADPDVVQKAVDNGLMTEPRGFHNLTTLTEKGIRWLDDNR